MRLCACRDKNKLQFNKVSIKSTEIELGINYTLKYAKFTAYISDLRMLCNLEKNIK